MNANRARGVFLAGTDTDVGKTRVAIGLIRALTAQGCRTQTITPSTLGAAAGPIDLGRS